MSARRFQGAVAAAFIALATMTPARGTTGERAEEEVAIGACIRRAAGGRPWLEKTLWGLRDQEAGWIGAEVMNRNGTHDLGPLQVNSWWGPRIAAITGRPLAQVRHWLINDPCFNVSAARWIFLSGLATARSYWKAVGLYHSPTGWRQQRYSMAVARHLMRRFGKAVFDSDHRDALSARGVPSSPGARALATSRVDVPP